MAGSTSNIFPIKYKKKRLPAKHYPPSKTTEIHLQGSRVKSRKKGCFHLVLFLTCWLGEGYDPLLVSVLARWQAERIWCTWVSMDLTFLKQSACGSAAEDNDSTKEVTEMPFFPARFGYLCCVEPSVCSVPHERLFPFMWDTRKSSLREATGHWPAKAQSEIQSQITSPKPNTQTRTNCVWILSRVNFIVLPNSREIEDVCSQASTQEAYPLPAPCPGKRPD